MTNLIKKYINLIKGADEKRFNGTKMTPEYTDKMKGMLGEKEFSFRKKTNELLEKTSQLYKSKNYKAKKTKGVLKGVLLDKDKEKSLA